MPATKRFYFVDESGQDTRGLVFVVAISVVESNLTEIETACLELEKSSGKGRQKWRGSSSDKRLSFVRSVVEDIRFQGVLCFSAFENIGPAEFDAYTVTAIARTVELTRDEPRSTSEVYIDGLTVKKQGEYGRQLRRHGISRVFLHRATDQGYPLVRLADTLAGLVRDALDKPDSEAARLLNRGLRTGTIVRVTQ
jgi:hypothetical protein